MATTTLVAFIPSPAMLVTVLLTVFVSEAGCAGIAAIESTSTCNFRHTVNTSLALTAAGVVKSLDSASDCTEQMDYALTASAAKDGARSLPGPP